MKSIKYSFMILGSMGLILLIACSNAKQAANTEKNSTIFPSGSTKTDGNHGASHGGQVVETGKYHLEFVPQKEANGTHLDLYLQTGDNHDTLPNAKVTAQVQLPNGKQTTIPFTYDAHGQHYQAMLNEKTSGQYQLKIMVDIKGEKANGRFNFNR
ncbi:hypothetical protein GSN00_11365 [Cylindrospermopsis raciborskii CHAB3438]|jgi:hypothetical protein|uniref:hypothetical protein n=1 Tax=Cylindrospermopsis raciborskii TaxID=77022 RepID=UPI001F3311F4|nr:hypothetical protein [Cylindrospermopsis raciborskii]MCH4904959.1 hypothetical protein [Cylindrospermopsis raciborskii CHAB3438]MEB3146446.1 hypothetical protein [Cylindrospermopsis raciborskii]UJS06086.1 hypothetical protein L3I90_07685 [Cylindrospermopsis raciborskii KLL07]